MLPGGKQKQWTATQKGFRVRVKSGTGPPVCQHLAVKAHQMHRRQGAAEITHSPHSYAEARIYLCLHQNNMWGSQWSMRDLQTRQLSALMDRWDEILCCHRRLLLRVFERADSRARQSLEARSLKAMVNSDASKYRLFHGQYILQIYTKYILWTESICIFHTENIFHLNKMSIYYKMYFKGQESKYQS